MTKEVKETAPAADGPSFGKRVAYVTSGMSVPKNLNNQFGGYVYRNAEMIYQQAKPLLLNASLFLSVIDTIEIINRDGKDRVFCKAECYLIDLDTEQHTPSAYGWAELADSKKGMDAGQLTGATASYARKYAMCALFGVDDNKDLDHPELHVNNPVRREAPQQQQPQQPQRTMRPQVEWPNPAEMSYTEQREFVAEKCKAFREFEWKSIQQLHKPYVRLVTFIKACGAEIGGVYLAPLEKVKNTHKARLGG